ncbi:MAG: hypothetical protein GY841_10115 [FCB group bacterium]|nr:hypothetical protein [FCB group bacterium]
MLFDYNNPRRIVFKTKQSASNQCGRPVPVKDAMQAYDSIENRAHRLTEAGTHPGGVGHNSVSVAILTNCPECGGYLVRMGYCFSCMMCGWGACG